MTKADINCVLSPNLKTLNLSQSAGGNPSLTATLGERIARRLRPCVSQLYRAGSKKVRPFLFLCLSTLSAAAAHIAAVSIMAS